MTSPKNIILVGFMGSGKSHVGRLLSARAGWPLVDADDEIVRRAGKPIHRIFEEQGEAAFRALERLVITDLCAGSGQVISAGGGAFIDPDNRRCMLASGLVVCLSARPETIYRRVNSSSRTLPGQENAASKPGPAVRPLLAGDGPLERIKTLLAQRAPAYAQAHHTIETDRLTPAQVTEAILKLWGPAAGKH